MWKTLHQILCVRKKNLQSASDLNQFIASIDDIDDLLNDKIKLVSSQIGLTDRNTVDFVLKKHEFAGLDHHMCQDNNNNFFLLLKF